MKKLSTIHREILKKRIARSKANKLKFDKVILSTPERLIGYYRGHRVSVIETTCSGAKAFYYTAHTSITGVEELCSDTLLKNNMSQAVEAITNHLDELLRK